MTITSLLFSCALFFPLVAAVVAFFYGKAVWANTVSQSISVVSGLSGLAGAALFYTATWGTFAAMHLPGLLGDVFVVTTLSAFFVGLISLGVVLTSLFSMWYLPHYATHYSLKWLNVASIVFVVSMLACVMSSTLLGFLVFWEAMSVAVYFLVIADRTHASMEAGFLYFVMAHLGFVALLAGFLMLAGGDPFLSFAEIRAVALGLSPATLGLAFLLLFFGFGSKAGIVPLHQWLPEAHPAAPSPSSALMSGVMLKMAVFGFVQALFLFPAFPLWYGLVVFGFGMLTAFFGVLYATVEPDLKRFLAWSSIENMGLIFSGLGALGILIALPTALIPESLMYGVALFVVVHTLGHSVFKTGLFMSAGVVTRITHTRDMDEMGGLARDYPVFSFAFLILALSAAALPPFLTFYGEWAYLQALALALQVLPLPFQIGAVLSITLLALVGGLALFAFVKAFSAIFLGRGRSAVPAGILIAPLLVPIAVSAVLVLGLSFFVRGIASFFEQTHVSFLDVFSGVSLGSGASIFPLHVAGLLVLLGGLVTVVYLFMRNNYAVRVTDTWDCGQPLTRRMEYTATGFAAPIRFFFRGLVVTSKSLVGVPIVSENPWIQNKVLQWDVTSFWARWLYHPIGFCVYWVAHRVKRIQNGQIQFYLFLVFIALLGTIVFAL